MKIVHDHAGIVFTFRWNMRSRCAENRDHERPEYAHETLPLDSRYSNRCLQHQWWPPMIQFEDRAVAFIDILGFKQLVNQAALSATDLAKLNDLVALLGAVIPFLDGEVQSSVPQHLIPRHLCISDCIILSAPLQVSFDEHKNYSGLEILVMRVIQVTQLFLDFGYLVRGGIEIGKVWHTESNIVGPAYQEALRLEQTAKMPRVILSDSATQLWRTSGESVGNRMCIAYQGQCIVNSLHSYYIPARFNGNISAAYDRYSSIVTHNLNAGLNPAYHSKWQWMQQYLADAEQ